MNMDSNLTFQQDILCWWHDITCSPCDIIHWSHNINIGHMTSDLVTWLQMLVMQHQLLVTWHQYWSHDLRCWSCNISCWSHDINIGHMTLDVGHATSAVGHMTADVGHATSDVGHMASDVSHMTSDVDHMTWDISHMTSHDIRWLRL